MSTTLPFRPTIARAGASRGITSTSGTDDNLYGQAVHKDFGLLSETGSAILRAWRQEAMTRFERLGFPTQRMEAWRKFPVRQILSRPFSISAQPTDRAILALPADALKPHLLPDSLRLVFINGRYQPDLSSECDQPNGMHIGSVAVALKLDPKPLMSEVGTLTEEFDPFAVLNATLFEDGACIRLPDDVQAEQPVQVLLISTPEGKKEAQAVYPRNHFHLGRNSRLKVLVQQINLDTAGNTPDYFSNILQQITLAEDAQLDLTMLVDTCKNSWTLQATRAQISQNAQLNLSTVTLGEGTARYNIETHLNGREASVKLNGLDILVGSGSAHHETLMSHQVPDCVSDQFYKGILDDQSVSAFSGMVYVATGADGTDSQQLNKNLLLSDNAKAFSRPQLQINAHDVKCAHGATVGSLEEDQLFYLASRGLDRDLSQSLLTYGFAEEVVQRIEQPAIRALLDASVLNSLHTATIGELKQELRHDKNQST